MSQAYSLRHPVKQSSQHFCGQRRIQAGSLTIEVSMIAGFLCVMAAFCSNLGLVTLAASVNDLACRDAARAAAQASTSDVALKMAQAAVLAHTTDGYFITQPTVSSADFVFQDYAGNPPANTSPFVQVTTISTVKVPAPVMFWGAKFEENGLLTCRRTYTFPIVKTQLYL